MTPNVINFHITDKCNYHCQYCFARFHQENLPLDEAKHVIDNISNFFKLKNVENPRINIAGGEPLLYPYIDEVIDYIHQKEILVSIITNASNLTVEHIHKWKGKVESIGISIDAVNAQTNLCIGRCQYGKPLDLNHLLEVTTAIHQNGIRLKINTVVSKLNLNEEMKTVYTLLAPDKLKFLAMHVLDNKNEKVKDLAPTNKEYYNFVNLNKPETKTQIVIEEPGSMENAYFMINPQGEVYLNDKGTEKKYGSCVDQSLLSIFNTIPLSMEKYQNRYQKD